MKYIRTKDKISGERIYENDIPEPKNEHEKEILQKLRDNIGEVIIKQADTIEELCDEFVCLENKMTFHNLETITSSCNLKHLTIYGAIWTDKGLIYVAKMKGISSSGEIDWELL